MKYDFHDIQNLVKVREALSDLLLKLDDIKQRLNDSNLDELDDTFDQFLSEANTYRKTEKYKILAAYEHSASHEDYFSAFDFDFFMKLRTSNRTVADFMSIIIALDTTISKLYSEADYISENYLWFYFK